MSSRKHYSAFSLSIVMRSNETMIMLAIYFSWLHLRFETLAVVWRLSCWTKHVEYHNRVLAIELIFCKMPRPNGKIIVFLSKKPLAFRLASLNHPIVSLHTCLPDLVANNGLCTCSWHAVTTWLAHDLSSIHPLVLALVWSPPTSQERCGSLAAQYFHFVHLLNL